MIRDPAKTRSNALLAGNGSFARTSLMVACGLALIGLFACEAKRSGKVENARTAYSIVDEEEVRRIVNGVWYKKRTPVIAQPYLRHFSWGDTMIDYQTGLFFDLQKEWQIMGLADGGWDKVDLELPGKPSNRIVLHLGSLATVKLQEEMTISVIDKDQIDVQYGSGDTGYGKMLSGRYFKAIDPSTP